MPTFEHHGAEVWDVHCKVVDHFGDAGVVLRLARRLCVEFGYVCRVFIDQPEVLIKLAGARVDGNPCSSLSSDPIEWKRQPFWSDEHGIEVWHDTCFESGCLDFDLISLPAPYKAQWPRVVIETFGCGVPEIAQALWEQHPYPPFWLNVDYLSAELWVGGSHGLASYKTSILRYKPEWRLSDAGSFNALRMYWFFPGFRDDTGGLIRERWLDDRLALSFEQLDALRIETLGDKSQRTTREQRLLYLFCYDDEPMVEALDGLGLGRGEAAWKILLPEGVGPTLRGALININQCEVVTVPFVPQRSCDAAIAGCDLLVVRGEDSFVRAQWAATPMLWHIYEQHDQAHWVKLEHYWTLWAQVVGTKLSVENLAPILGYVVRFYRGLYGELAAQSLLSALVNVQVLSAFQC